MSSPPLTHWITDKEKIRGEQPLRKSIYNNPKEALLVWFTSKRTKDLLVSGPMLLAKAQEFTVSTGPLKSTMGFIDNFKARYEIVFQKTTAKLLMLTLTT